MDVNELNPERPSPDAAAGLEVLGWGAGGTDGIPALLDSGRLDAAEAAAREGVRARVGDAGAWNELGCVLLERREVCEACGAFRTALRLKDTPEARMNLALGLLTLGRFAEGWEYFEYPKGPAPRHAGPVWDGSTALTTGGSTLLTTGGLTLLTAGGSMALSAGGSDGAGGSTGLTTGKTILLYGEGGLGNVIQFARYAARVAGRGAKVVLECPAALKKLLGTVPGVERVIAGPGPDGKGGGEAPPPFHFHAPLAGLPRIFGTTLETIPAEIPYVSAEAGLVRHWGRALKRLGGFKVGIVWQAEQRTAYGRRRSIPLEAFAPLSRIPAVKLVSLQKAEPGQAGQMGPGGNMSQAPFPMTVLADLDGSRGAFMDTAAVMKNLDLVITADTSTAHLAGALGVAVWVAERYAPDWRWMLDREDSPWYPTLRLFRQSTPGDWNSVFDRMAAELSRRAA